MRSSLDPLAFPELRWLRAGLGGKLGPATAAAIERGHPGLEWLDLTETRLRTVTDLCCARSGSRRWMPEVGRASSPTTRSFATSRPPNMG